MRTHRQPGWLWLVASSWIVKFSLGWDELTPDDRHELQRHFSMTPAGTGTAGGWEVRVRSDTAATAFHEVSLMLGREREERLRACLTKVLVLVRLGWWGA